MASDSEELTYIIEEDKMAQWIDQLVSKPHILCSVLTWLEERTDSYRLSSGLHMPSVFSMQSEWMKCKIRSEIYG